MSSCSLANSSSRGQNVYFPAPHERRAQRSHTANQPDVESTQCKPDNLGPRVRSALGPLVIGAVVVGDTVQLPYGSGGLLYQIRADEVARSR